MNQKIMPDIYVILLTSGIAMTGIYLSNRVYDKNVPNYISRKIGHFFGGTAFLVGYYLFSSPLWPIILTSGFSLFFLFIRYVKPKILRGVGGYGRESKSSSEIWFTLASALVIIISWQWFNMPAVAITCLLFMAWGDCVTGLIRSRIYHKSGKGIAGSFGMLVICLVIAWFFIKPFWIGVFASVVATIVEWFFGDTSHLKWGDDNWAIPILSMITIFFLLSITGNFKTGVN